MANTSTSFWKKFKISRFPKVKHYDGYDVIVIGGGITGLTTAYLLKQAGKRVCVIERDRIASGDTGYTTAHLTFVTDTRLKKMVDVFGKDATRLAWHGGAVAINIIEELANHLKIECDFNRIDGFLHAPVGQNTKELDSEVEELMAEAALAEELEIKGQFLDEVPLMNRPGIRYPNQALFHPLKYLAGLAEAIEGDGSNIFESSEATEFEEDPARVVVNGKKIQYEHLVIATHVPLMGQSGLISAALLQSKLSLYSSYVVGAKISRQALSNISFWDTASPYNYLRIDHHPKNDYVILGGEDHKTGQVSNTEECYSRVKKRLMKMFPEGNIDTHWSGQVVESVDSLPYIGSTAKNQYIATAFAGNGMTFGTLAATIIRDAILKRENPWQELFSVDRKKFLASSWKYIKENFDYPYYMISDWLLKIDSGSLEDVNAGEGKIVNLHGQRIACSRDENGKLCMVSAICTHLGGIVHWNNSEKTWDCPCHGSRFHADGTVLAGPAETPLKKLQNLEASETPILIQTEPASS